MAVDVTARAREGIYSSLIGSLKRDLAEKKNLEKKRESLLKSLVCSQKEFFDMTNAQKVLSTISDDNTTEVLKFITSMVNKVLADIFPDDIKRIQLTKKLFAGSKPHINVEVVNGDGIALDLNDQEGAGIGQIISVLYIICLIEIRKGRRLVILDEKLNGLHERAKVILAEIIKIFSEAGFQFIFVEYSLNNLGKIYIAEKRGNESQLVPFDGVYEDYMVYSEDGVKDVDLSILDEGYVAEGEDEIAKEIVIS